MKDIKIPLGISDFQKIRENHYYYIDKTMLIKELLEKSAAMDITEKCWML